MQKMVVRAYENMERPERYIVRIFEKYMDLRPKGAPDVLYLRPRTPYDKEWYGRIRGPWVVIACLVWLDISARQLA